MFLDMLPETYFWVRPHTEFIGFWPLTGAAPPIWDTASARLDSSFDITEHWCIKPVVSGSSFGLVKIFFACLELIKVIIKMKPTSAQISWNTSYLPNTQLAQPWLFWGREGAFRSSEDRCLVWSRKAWFGAGFLPIVSWCCQSRVHCYTWLSL